MSMQNPNPSSLSDKWALLLQSAIKSRNPLLGRCIHAPIIKQGLCLGVFLMNNLLNFYAKTGFFSDAHCLFHEMPLKTTFSWNTILSMHVKGGHLDSARQLFDEIPHPDSVSWTTMIVGYNHLGLFNTLLTRSPHGFLWNFAYPIHIYQCYCLMFCKEDPEYWK